MARKPAELNDPPEVVAVSFFNVIVCAKSDATDEELTKAANAQELCGTKRGWASVVRDSPDEPQMNPVPCMECPGRTHFIINC